MHAGFVADIFTTFVEQGPSLPMQQRQALTRPFNSDPASFVSRIHAALDAVSPMFATMLAHAPQAFDSAAAVMHACNGRPCPCISASIAVSTQAGAHA